MVSTAKTPDRAARTEKARRAALDNFEQQVDPERVMSPADRRKAAINAQKARMNALAQKGVDARARKRAARKSGTAGE